MVRKDDARESGRPVSVRVEFMDESPEEPEQRRSQSAHRSEEAS